MMSEDVALKDIPQEDLPLLLSDLESDLPNSINARSFLKSILRWKAANEEMEAKILAPNGDFRNKFIVFYITPSDLSDVRGSIHKWSHQKEDDEFVRDTLRISNQIPWRSIRRIVLTSMTLETYQAVIPVLGEKWEGERWYTEPEHRLYWIHKEEAENLAIDAPNGTHLSFLTEAHSKEIDDNWPHRHEGSRNVISAMIRINFGIGLFHSESKELMSWAIHWFYGAIGVLHTKDHHRKKGYGTAVMKAITREIARRGDDVFLNTIPNNDASNSLAEKLNYKLVSNSAWVYKGYISKESQEKKEIPK